MPAVAQRMQREFATFYAPGYVCVVAAEDAASFSSGIGPHAAEPHAASLYRQAQVAEARLHARRQAAFEPECLTVFLDPRCNLRCVYCGHTPAPGDLPVAFEVIEAGARLVAQSCRRRQRGLSVVFHGGGEPTLEPERLERALECVEHAAHAEGVALFRYVASNGTVSERRAAWLAQHFDLIGVSCDGPPEIHDLQRPFSHGGGSLATVRRAATVIRDAGGRLNLRVTVTPSSLARQAEIVEYLCATFAPVEIVLEPAYRNPKATRNDLALTPAQVDGFVAGFLDARAAGARLHVPVTCSLLCSDWLHTSFCHVFRGVLNLVPGNVASACFVRTSAVAAERQGCLIASWDAERGCINLHVDHLAVLAARLSRQPTRCRDCFNRFHCCGDCPDVCPLSEDWDERSEGGARCRTQRLLAERQIDAVAARLWSELAQSPSHLRPRVNGAVLDRENGAL